MTYPTGWDLVNVTGTYVARDGVPCAGSVTFSSPQLVLRSGTIVPAADIVFTLNASGSFAGQIPATDDPNANPSGWVYTVSENVPGGRQGYQIVAPHTSPGIDLSTVIPIGMPMPPTFGFPYVTLAQLSAQSFPTGASLVGFLQRGTGAAGRNLQSKAQEIISVTDFGAVGDGVTNNNAAFASALAYLESNSVYRGGILYIPAGHYILTAALDFTSYSLLENITLQGDGESVTALDFTGSPASTDGIDIPAGTQFWIRDLSVANCTGIGINIGFGNTVGGSGYCDRFAIQRVRVQGCGSHGISSTNSYLGTFEDIWSTANGGDGFNFNGYHTSINFKNCEAGNNTGWGYAINGMVYSAFVGCGSDSNGQDGYSFTNSVGIALVACGAESNQKAAWNFHGAGTTGLPAEAYGVHGIVLISCCAFFNSAAGAGLYAAFTQVAPDANGADVRIIGGEVATTSASDVANVVSGASGSALLRMDGLLRVTTMAADQVTSGGVLTNVAAQGQAAIATMSVSQSLTTATTTNLTLDTLGNNDMGATVSGGNIVIPANVRKIRIDAAVSFVANATGIRQVFVLVNGAAMAGCAGVTANAVSAGATVLSLSSGVISVTPGSTVTLQAYQNSGGALSAGSGLSATYLALTAVG